MGVPTERKYIQRRAKPWVKNRILGWRGKRITMTRKNENTKKPSFDLSLFRAFVIPSAIHHSLHIAVGRAKAIESRAAVNFAV